jgi:hypothetical protein
MGSRFERTEPRENKSACHSSCACDLFCALSLSDSLLFLTLTRLVVVINFVNCSFALFTPPLGDFQYEINHKQENKRGERKKQIISKRSSAKNMTICFSRLCSEECASPLRCPLSTGLFQQFPSLNGHGDQLIFLSLTRGHLVPQGPPHKE